MPEQNPVVVLVTDVQADFTQFRNGTLPVPGTGSDYVDEVVFRTRAYRDAGLSIVGIRDYHPADHMSFYTSHPGHKAFDAVRINDREQVLWPPHCVQGTSGAEILVPQDTFVARVSKGTRKDFDSYSAFKDDGGHDTGLNALLEEMGARHLIIYGLATDYCVKATVLHALQEGYGVTVVTRLCRGITPESAGAALEEMKMKGAVVED
jgi:nicotinamidase/pyrazinamidase